MITLKMRRPRRQHVLRLWTSAPDYHDCSVCNTCMDKFAEIVENERPGHVWSVQDGEIVYLEDVVMERKLGRKLKPTEGIVHKDGNLMNNTSNNLEIVTLENLETE
jgi:hypothetical protein